jgi:alanyl-tRNA synthetase
MMDSLLKQECDLQFFHDNGYLRKKCRICGAYFWTLNGEEELCGDQPCVEFGFINNPVAKKPFSLKEVREEFLSFFEKHGHSKVSYPETGDRCPVIARWRSDIYLTIASIADFQPHVTSGEVPAPANPLVISQPCIRLNDLEEIGISGRHLSMFEMMGHHAFNKNTDEIYWKEETTAYCDEFFRKNIGIPREWINYKEHLWVGGGNAGPCLEVIAGGLELATLVFMNMKEDEKGTILINGGRYLQNPLNIVDTGYGLERIAWFTTGTVTIYETVFPEVIDFLIENTGDTHDMASIYALADHSKCLAFMLGDGIVPSNVKAGYLARLIIRRSLRFLEKLKLKLPLKELVDMHLDLLDKEFPSLKQRKDQVDEILDIETNRFYETLSKGESLVKRILREKAMVDKDALIALYDTHGMPPDVVKNIAKKEGVEVTIPKNFDSMIAELHSREEKEEKKEEIHVDLPETKPLYYTDHYLKEFDAKVLWKQETEDGVQVILDKTTFYPEGGGQPGDIGTLYVDEKKLQVKHVEKKGKSILHLVEGDIEVGDTVHGEIDWERRYTLMKHHTGTHVINGALRMLLGEHIWQAGSQLGVNDARFDFSHYKPLTEEEVKEIEKQANKLIEQESRVEKKVMERNEAEREFGFRLYQGGVPPGNTLRVINIPGIDVEACGGTHLNNIKEVEKIRVLKTERIQDGVNRIVFAAGKMADIYQEEENALYKQITDELKTSYIIKEQKNISEQLKEACKIFSVSTEQLPKTIKRFLRETGEIEKTTVNDFKEACAHLFNTWKATQKMKKKVPPEEIQRLKNQAEVIPGTEIKVVAGRSEFDAVSTVVAISKDKGYVAHVYDGDKIASSASTDVNIDLRLIAPEIGKILGGSGGGKPKLTRSGGPQIDKVEEALHKAKKLTEEALT